MIVFDFRKIHFAFLHNRIKILKMEVKNTPLLKILKHFLLNVIDINDLESDCLSTSRNDK